MLKQNPIIQFVGRWFEKTFSKPGTVSLFLFLLIGFLFLEFFGRLFLPVLISIVFAYLLQTLVRGLENLRFPHLLSVTLVFLVFVGLLVVAVIVLLPLLVHQLSNLINELPHALTKGQALLTNLERRYPAVFNKTHLDQWAGYFQKQLTEYGQVLLRYSLATIPGIIQIVLYIILVPLLVFFFLKDRQEIIAWFEAYLPSDRGLVLQVWFDVKGKIGGYVRGRILEAIIVAIISVSTFTILGLQYAILLGALVGLSVIIPYIGAVVVTIPVGILALVQWGLSSHFTYFVIAYALILVVDANVLAPLLLSETVSLHPVVIILSVVIFGKIWGFWGVFFAIPLATLINAVLKAWPRRQSSALSSSSD